MNLDESGLAGQQPETPEEIAPALAPEQPASTVVAPTGKRPAFSKIRRELSEQDLANPGVQKMILEELERAEEKLAAAEVYLDKFHMADKDVGILTEKLRSQKANEVLFVAGVTFGSILVGLGPSFWDAKWGWVVPSVGIALLVGSLASRVENMNLSIKQILDRGIPGKERLWMVAQADLDLAFYVVFDTQFEGDGISSQPKHVHWWPNYKVQKGDYVILYTAPGSEQSRRRQDGKTNHFFHWGFPGGLWHDKNSCAVLLELTGWETWPSSPGK